MSREEAHITDGLVCNVHQDDLEVLVCGVLQNSVVDLSATNVYVMSASRNMLHTNELLPTAAAARYCSLVTAP